MSTSDVFLIFFSKLKLSMFLKYPKNRALRSYKLRSYKKSVRLFIFGGIEVLYRQLYTRRDRVSRLTATLFSINSCA